MAAAVRSAAGFQLVSSKGDSIETNLQIDSPLLSRKEAARYLGMAYQTLAQWAVTGRYGLPFVKIGRYVKYRLTDLDAFILRRTSETGTTIPNGWQQ